MTFAFILQESFIILKAIQNLELIITSLPRQDVLTVLEPVAADLYHNLNELLLPDKKESFFKDNYHSHPPIATSALKLMARLSPF